ncbi:MAG: GAF domain-containing protein [Flavobacteriales bacterium]|nr:GAF domain-containing protein [Flavobacteriales bacterium]
MNKKHSLLFGEIKAVVDSDMDSDDVLRFVCQMLHDGVAGFDWVGIYRYDEKEKMLHLGPYCGEETIHTEIEYGHGVCGRVAESGERLVIDDVSQEENYIACSLEVKSEIVVPIIRAGRAIAQIDIDSHSRGIFGAEEIELIEGVSREIKDFV